VSKKKRNSFLPSFALGRRKKKAAAPAAVEGKGDNAGQQKGDASGVHQQLEGKECDADTDAGAD